jgi:hypothetical protein
MSDAILDTLHDIPSRVPRRERSGVIFAKAADGSVTKAAEKNPVGRQSGMLHRRWSWSCQ